MKLFFWLEKLVGEGLLVTDYCHIYVPQVFKSYSKLWICVCLTHGAYGYKFRTICLVIIK